MGTSMVECVENRGEQKHKMIVSVSMQLKFGSVTFLLFTWTFTWTFTYCFSVKDSNKINKSKNL